MQFVGRPSLESKVINVTAFCVSKLTVTVRVTVDGFANDVNLILKQPLGDSFRINCRASTIREVQMLQRTIAHGNAITEIRSW